MQTQKEEVRLKILDSGKKMFFKHGYRAAKVSDIAFLSGISDGNLYRYYKNKLALFEAVVAPALTGLSEAISRIWETSQGVSLNIMDSVNFYTDEIMKLVEKFGMELIILTDKSESTGFEKYYLKLVELIQSIVTTFLYSDDADDQARFFGKITGEGFYASMVEIIRSDMDMSAKRNMIRKLLIFYFRYIAERK